MNFSRKTYLCKTTSPDGQGGFSTSKTSLYWRCTIETQNGQKLFLGMRPALAGTSHPKIKN